VGVTCVQEWQEDVPSSGTVELVPEGRSMQSLGRNHSLESAIADLADNSIDAGASHIRIRFVRTRGRLTALCVVDNGRGIAPENIDRAMTVGGTREYSATDLGHFGVGLKAASFSQAGNLTVLSRSASQLYVGRKWTAGRVGNSFACDIVPSEFVIDEFDRDWGPDLSTSGTIVRWDDIHTFPATADDDRVEDYLSHSITIVREHLGLVFHRVLEANDLCLDIDVANSDTLLIGPPVAVTPIDPFGYQRSGRPRYPKQLIAHGESGELVLRCHVWPGRSTLPQFKLPGGPMDRQGLYFYRHGRLLQAGGWDGIRAADRRLQLARVEVEIDGDSEGLYRMNPEKSRVHITQEFGYLAEQARADDGTSLSDYLTDAEDSFRTARKRSQKRQPMLPPGKGFAAPVRRAISDEVPLHDSEQGIDIRWKNFSDDTLLDVDHGGRTLWLNSRYRSAILGGRSGSLNDAPVLKALLYLLTESVFNGEYLGRRDRDNVELWSEILTAAARSETR
jgi:hypothetical protein